MKEKTAVGPETCGRSAMGKIELGSYEDICPSLRVRLADMKAEAETLQKTVYEPVGCGYALMAYMVLPEECGEGATANVPRDLAEAAGVSERRIMHDARIGSMAADVPKLCPIEEMLFGPGESDLLTGGEMPEDARMLVLSNRSGRLGAGVLYYPGVAKKIAEVVGEDYYVLPSSVHEVLIMPDRHAMPAKDLAEMVKDINEHEVSPRERLGNRVLHYRGDLERLQVAADLDRDRDCDRERG